MSKQCRFSCRWWGADPDGEYCAHPEAVKHSMFGINLDRALGPNPRYPESYMSQDPAIGICGPDRKLWEMDKTERAELWKKMGLWSSQPTGDDE